MKAKKGVSIGIVIVLVLLATQMGFCGIEKEAKSENIFLTDDLNYTMITTDTWNVQDTQNSSSKIKQAALNDKDQFFHNNGAAITTDLFQDGETEGNYLVAVYRTVRDGRMVESYYFTTEPTKNKEKLVKRVTEEEVGQMSQIMPLAVGNEARYFSWVEEKMERNWRN